MSQKTMNEIKRLLTIISESDDDPTLEKAFMDLTIEVLTLPLNEWGAPEVDEDTFLLLNTPKLRGITLLALVAANADYTATLC